MQDSEEYLGGLSSPFLGKGRRLGYGIAVTDARLIGFNITWARLTLLAGPAIAAAGGIIKIVQSVISSSFPSPADPSTIVLGTSTILGGALFIIVYIICPTWASPASVIERKNDFDVTRESLRGIAIRRPQGLGMGLIMIDLQSGDAIKIIIGYQKAFRKTMELVRTFYPETREIP